MSDPFAGYDVGYNIPAKPGMSLAEVQTPCLILDLDALERNVERMGRLAAEAGVRLRPHAKTHKSADVALMQMERGGACGICCQKVSEAEALARGGVYDIFITNEVRAPLMIERLARLPRFGVRTLVCVDDPANVAELSAAAFANGTELECVVEIDCGAGRCGVAGPDEVVALARAIDAAPGLRFAGLQAYQGAAQHIEDHAARRAALDAATAIARDAVAALSAAGFDCDVIGGGGTGSWVFEADSGVWNELQCGSYAFMDADYGRIRDGDGRRFDDGSWENALFVLAGVISHVKPTVAVVDAGLKSLSTDSGLPIVAGQGGFDYLGASDEHGVVADPEGALAVGDRVRLIPGHCDPTCNLHDWYVGVRGGVVETVWPVTARGKSF